MLRFDARMHWTDPTLLLLRGGEKFAEFKGPRTFDALTEFVDRTLSQPPTAPGAPRAHAPGAKPAGGSGSSRLSRESMKKRLARLGQSLAELEPLHAGLIALGTVCAMGLGLLLLLCATTTASPR
jgi:hypothetical protein